MTLRSLSQLALTRFTVVSAAGRGIDATARALLEMRGGLRPAAFAGKAYPTWVGEVDGLDEVELPRGLHHFSCRNNRLAELALRQDGFAETVQRATADYGPERIAIILGTTTSGVREGELAFAERDGDGRLPASFDHANTVDYDSLSRFVATRLGIGGPVFTVSTACSSSSRAMIDAWHLISSGWCDAAVVGGVDSLCEMTLCGFASLELLGRDPCAPFDMNRAGISLGEAAGFVLLERADSPRGASAIRLVGGGASCDAHHMSAPDPTGEGARLAMLRALASSQLTAECIDHVNMHGTGTRLNDVSEDAAVASVLGANTACSSVKGWVGHCLGAAGVVSVTVSALSLERQMMPGNLNLQQIDPEIRCRILRRTESRPFRFAMINAFGFGGNNCSLILGAPT